MIESAGKNSRQPPSNEIDTIAYAVSFFEAAGLVSNTDEWPDNAPMVVPFYMLIGFSLENGLKAVLEYLAVPASENWSHSHDLSKLRLLAGMRGFSLPSEVISFVDHLSPLHKQHQFRYPQKAETAELLKPRPALDLTHIVLRLAFEFVGGPARSEEF
jgi:hypothetical protein